MARIICCQYANVGALATAAIVTFGMVTAPPEPVAPVSARTASADVHLRAAVSTQLAALVNTAATSVPSGAVTASASGTASTGGPLASATSFDGALTAIATAAIALVAAPFWYLGFPVTLPLSIASGISSLQITNLLPLGFGAGGRLDPLTVVLGGAALGLFLFVGGPLAIAFSAVSSLFTAPAYLVSAAAQAVYRPGGCGDSQRKPNSGCSRPDDGS